VDVASTNDLGKCKSLRIDPRPGDRAMLRLFEKEADIKPEVFRGMLGNNGEYPPAARIAGDVGSAGSWEEVATAVISEATLVEQPRGKEFEYRIIAVNKAGEGEPSNTAMVVL